MNMFKGWDLNHISKALGATAPLSVLQLRTNWNLSNFKFGYTTSLKCN